MDAANESLRTELLDMIAEDERVRAELASDESLFRGYHPAMESVHLRNAERLSAIIREHGWPTKTLVLEDGADAAWRILQHAISRPTLQREGLMLMRELAGRGEVKAAQVAMLEDRICVLEGRPQVYGTQFDWDVKGEMSPLPMQDAATVNERRRRVGLDSLEERTSQVRREIGQTNERPPEDYASRQREIDEWARRVGWRD